MDNDLTEAQLAAIAAHRARLDPTSPTYDPEFAALREAAKARMAELAAQQLARAPKRRD
jgi:hypothetical protein